eukprot:SAG22_NODE_733_length_7580_cov_2.329501_1_plen_407_part_00
MSSLADLSPRWSNTRALSALKILLAHHSGLRSSGYRSLFDTIDANHDSHIDPDELQKYVTARHLELQPADIAAVMTLGDRNGDGRINCAEWERLGAVWAEIDDLRAALSPKPAAVTRVAGAVKVTPRNRRALMRGSAAAAAKRAGGGSSSRPGAARQHRGAAASAAAATAPPPVDEDIESFLSGITSPPPGPAGPAPAAAPEPELRLEFEVKDGPPSPATLDAVHRAEEPPPPPPWTHTKCVSAPRQAVLKYMLEWGTPAFKKEHHLHGKLEALVTSLRPKDVVVAYRALLAAGPSALATPAEKAAAKKAAAARRAEKKRAEAANVEKARAKAKARHEALLEAQAASAAKRGVRGQVGKTRTGWQDVNSDGTPMNVGNKLRERPAITLHSHYNAGSAMQNALSDNW